MPFEDLGIMRVMPGITVLEPTDAVMMHSLIPQIANTYGVHYMRFPRRQVPKIYAEGSEFTIGKGVLLREGTDVTIMAYGIMVAEALKAADELVAQGIQARVVDMFTIKPIDVQCVLESACKTGAIVTAENHQITGGLGSAVAEILAEHRPTLLERVGVNNEFGEVGLTAEKIIEAVTHVLKRKKHS